MRRFYVGTYSQGEGDIFTLEMEPRKRKLELVRVYTGLENPSFLARESGCLYAVSEQQEGGTLASFALGEDGVLSPTAIVKAPYAGLCHISIWPDRRAVSAASYLGGGAVTCPVEEDGVLKQSLQWLPNVGHSVNPERQERAHVHSLTPDAAGKFIIEADLGLDQLLVFRTSGGELIPHARVDVPPGEGPRHFAFHPSGLTAYLVTELGNHVICYDYDKGTGILRQRDMRSLLDGGEPGPCFSADLHVTAEGDLLLVSVRGVEHLVRFTLEPDGGLGERAFLPCGASGVRNFCVDAAGEFVVVADQGASRVRLFALNRESGCLGPCLDEIRIPCPVCVING